MLRDLRQSALLMRAFMPLLVPQSPPLLLLLLVDSTR